MPCNVESASLEPKFGNKFIAGGEDMWVRLFDFSTGEEIGMYTFSSLLSGYNFLFKYIIYYVYIGAGFVRNLKLIRNPRLPTP